MQVLCYWKLDEGLISACHKLYWDGASKREIVSFKKENLNDISEENDKANELFMKYEFFFLERRIIFPWNLRIQFEIWKRLRISRKKGNV